MWGWIIIITQIISLKKKRKEFNSSKISSFATKKRNYPLLTAVGSMFMSFQMVFCCRSII